MTWNVNMNVSVNREEEGEGEGEDGGPCAAVAAVSPITPSISFSTSVLARETHGTRQSWR